METLVKMPEEVEYWKRTAAEYRAAAMAHRTKGHTVLETNFWSPQSKARAVSLRFNAKARAIPLALPEVRDVLSSDDSTSRMPRAFSVPVSLFPCCHAGRQRFTLSNPKFT